jgi:hypothetical protein
MKKANRRRTNRRQRGGAIQNTAGTASILGKFATLFTPPSKQPNQPTTPKIYGTPNSSNLSFSTPKPLTPLEQAQANREAANAREAAAERKVANNMAKKERNARAAKSLQNAYNKRKQNALNAYEASLLNSNNPLTNTMVKNYKKVEKKYGVQFPNSNNTW